MSMSCLMSARPPVPMEMTRSALKWPEADNVDRRIIRQRGTAARPAVHSSGRWRARNKQTSGVRSWGASTGHMGLR